MAKSPGAIKAPRKKERVTNPLMLDEKYIGDEPVWDAERALKMSDFDFDHHLRASFRYYNYFHTVKTLRKYLSHFAKESGKYTAAEISKFNRSPDAVITFQACSLAKAHERGMPYKERHLEYMHGIIRDAIKSAAADEPIVANTAVVAPKPSIQDRLAEKTAEQMGELEGHFDEVLVGNSKFNHYEFLVANNVPQSQLSKYEERCIKVGAEIEEAQQGLNEQLTEGYSHYKAADFKRILGWLQGLMGAIEQYRNVKKATKKVRVKRAVSKEKVVAKLKYAKECKVNKVVSINPADIVGAQELWVYNTKTRKLGKYVADALQGPLGVKGTTITGYDTAKSVCKTLRKPEEKLKEFAKAGKVQLRKFLEDIKATETNLNGRINADMVLLKVQ